MFRKSNSVSSWSLGNKYKEPEEIIVKSTVPYSGTIDDDDEPPPTMQDLIDKASSKKVSMNKLRKIFKEMGDIEPE